MTITDGAPARAGFWRRVGALLIDFIIVLLPLQILVAILFAQTNGAVQGNVGFFTRICAPVSSIPEGLQPPPPANANSVNECRSGFFGFETSRTLSIGTVVQKNNVRSGHYMTYALDAAGKPTTPFNMNWLAMLALLTYLICDGMSARRNGRKTRPWAEDHRQRCALPHRHPVAQGGGPVFGYVDWRDPGTICDDQILSSARIR